MSYQAEDRGYLKLDLLHEEACVALVRPAAAFGRCLQYMLVSAEDGGFLFPEVSSGVVSEGISRESLHLPPTFLVGLA